MNVNKAPTEIHLIDYDHCKATDMLDVPAVTQEWVLASLFVKKLLPLKVSINLIYLIIHSFLSIYHYDCLSVSRNLSFY